MNDDVLLIERPAAGVALVRLNRPKVLNALSNAVVTRLAEVLEGLRRRRRRPARSC